MAIMLYYDFMPMCGSLYKTKKVSLRIRQSVNDRDTDKHCSSVDRVSILRFCMEKGGKKLIRNILW